MILKMIIKMIIKMILKMILIFLQNKYKQNRLINKIYNNLYNNLKQHKIKQIYLKQIKNHFLNKFRKMNFQLKQPILVMLVGLIINFLLLFKQDNIDHQKF